ncbi:general substrate transporter [Stachybotrys elegans]|uniref:General substrate transporter n=1 Tax=Stachybotrys elegans TaxID=80388 RepID=A0A8K0T274_9HYPO|nr:general substrate transporter [Stachybotrys elegans]
MLYKFLASHNYKVGQHVSTNLVLASMVMMSSVFAYGFENSVLATIQAMDAYERAFGQYDEKTERFGFTVARLAYLNSFPLITYAIGVIAAGQIGERWGRRVVFYGMNCICTIGVGICYAARSYETALVGRMIINLHVGAEAWLVPMWLAEIVPAAVRGSMVGLYPFSHVFASFLAAVVTNATSKIPGDESWKIPVLIMFAFPSFALLMAWALPESPRWLLRKGRHQEAIEGLLYINGADKNYPAEQEAQLILSMAEDAATKGKWSELFKGRRTWGGLIAAGANQLTGQSFASSYGTVFLKQIAVMDPFTGTLIKRSLVLGGCIFVITMVERLGRRRVALTVGSITTSVLMIMGGLGTIHEPNRSEKLGILAMTIIFPCTYIIAFGSTMTVIKAEIPHTSLRDKSNMLFWSCSNIGNFVTTFTVPYLIRSPGANLGSRVGFIYGSIAAVFLVLLFFFVPEMTGKSLEEIDEMFERRIPAWQSRNFRATGMAAAVTDLENHHASTALDEKLDSIENVVEKRS